VLSVDSETHRLPTYWPKASMYLEEIWCTRSNPWCTLSVGHKPWSTPSLIKRILDPRQLKDSRCASQPHSSTSIEQRLWNCNRVMPMWECWVKWLWRALGVTKFPSVVSRRFWTAPLSNLFNWLSDSSFYPSSTAGITGLNKGIQHAKRETRGT
jgi:hypothetical protein